jgi:hypothetical protein
MPTSAPLSLTSAISRADEKLTPAQLGYFQAYAQDRAHDLVRSLFMSEAESDKNLTRAFIARRLGKKPEQITRWLAVPGNWTLGTFADLLASMGYVPTFDVQRLDRMPPSNRHHPVLDRQPYPIELSEPKIGGSAELKTVLEKQGQIDQRRIEIFESKST